MYIVKQMYIQIEALLQMAYGSKVASFLYLFIFYKQMLSLI